MNVDEGKSIVGLVQADVTRLVGDAVVDGKAGVVFHVDRRGGCSGTSPVRKISFNHALLVVLVDEVLAVAEQTEGSQFGKEDEGEMGTCSKEGVRSTALFTFD